MHATQWRTQSAESITTETIAKQLTLTEKLFRNNTSVDATVQRRVRLLELLL